MSERWARAILTAYRLAGAAAYPLVGGYVAWRTSRGKEDRKRRRERYGITKVPRPDGPLIWVHAASVGETMAVTPLVTTLAASGIAVVLTTGTVSSANLAAERLGDMAIHQYVPLDLKPAVRRFLDHWRPDLAIMAESEIWPMTILELGARRVPQLLVNGRLSDRSFAAWQKRPHLAEALFENLAHVVAQSDIDGERFIALGARPVTISGNLKADMVAPPADDREVARLRAGIDGRPVWAAISTHDGEEESAANVHLTVKGRLPRLLTIVVPRHPERADAIAEAMERKGLKTARRSKGEVPDAATEIFIGDTIGEMGLYLRMTELAFVGRSLAGTGGQNPYEPAMLDTAVLSGMNVENFREAYETLIRAGGAKLVRDEAMLANAVAYLLTNDEARAAMIRAGAGAVAGLRGALARTMAALDPFVTPLVVEARLTGRGRADG